MFCAYWTNLVTWHVAMEEIIALWHQAITWTTGKLFFVGPLGTHFSEINIYKHAYDMMSSAKMTAIYADLNMLIDDKHRNFDDKKMPIAVNNATRYLMFFSGNSHISFPRNTPGKLNRVRHCNRSLNSSFSRQGAQSPKWIELNQLI